MPDSLAGFFAAVVGAGLVLIGWRLSGAMGGTAAAVSALILAITRCPGRKRSRNVEQAMTHQEFLKNGRPACMGHPPEKSDPSKDEARRVAAKPPEL
jgi:hypothetical protein